MARRIALIIVVACLAALLLLLAIAHPVAGPGPSAAPSETVAATATPAGQAVLPPPTPTTSPSPASTPTPVPSATPAGPTDSPNPTAHASGSPVSPSSSPPPPVSSPSASAPGGSFLPAGIVVDPGLLAVLPASVGESQVARDPEREAQSVADVALARYARAVVAAVVGDNGENIASVILVERRPETDMATWFAAYRSEFDMAACDPLGGPAATSTRTIGGREVHVRECKSGGTVLHVIVRGGSTVLSVFELGPGEFGKVLLEHLAPGS
jgi:hypothetical protein